MATALWADINDVKEHLGDAQNAKGWTDANVAEKIQGAEAYLAPYFTSAVTSGVVATWVSKPTTPKAVIRLVAMYSAMLVLESYGGQSVGDELSEAGSLWIRIKEVIKGLQDGSYQLVDPAGGAVSATLPFSTTENKTPTFTMGNEGDSSEGSLDNF